MGYFFGQSQQPEPRAKPQTAAMDIDNSSTGHGQDVLEMQQEFVPAGKEDEAQESSPPEELAEAAFDGVTHSAAEPAVPQQVAQQAAQAQHAEQAQQAQPAQQLPGQEQEHQGMAGAPSLHEMLSSDVDAQCTPVLDWLLSLFLMRRERGVQLAHAAYWHD